MILQNLWLELENKYGFAKARILAHAVSYAFKQPNQQFIPWFLFLKEEDREFVEDYFDVFLEMELREMSINKKSDISHLVKHFNLPDNKFPQSELYWNL